MEQRSIAEKKALAEAALRSVEVRFGVKRSTLLERHKALLKDSQQGQRDDAALAAMQEQRSAFDTALRKAEQDQEAFALELAAQKERDARTRARIKLNERVRKYVTSYLPPAPVRHMTLSFQAVYNAIAQNCLRSGRTSLTNEQIMGITGVSRSTVKRATGALHAAGIVIKTERYDIEANTNLPNLYRLATEELVKWARRVFKNLRGFSSEPQIRTGFIPVPTRGAQQGTEAQIETKGESRQEAEKDYSPDDTTEEIAAQTRLAKMALMELGEEVSSHAGPGTITKAIDRIRVKTFKRLEESEWKRHRQRLGRKADLALLETALLVDVRAGNVDQDKEAAWKKPIRSPSNYLHGILRKSASRCRPDVTLGRLLIARNRHVPKEIIDSIQAHNGERMRNRRALGRLGL